MIVRIDFKDGLTMLFGDSYKPWHMQFDEWYWRNKKEVGLPITSSMSKDKWIGWGGLKWCGSDNFQKCLNKEGRQYEEPELENPRQYSEMNFHYNTTVQSKINKICKQT